MIEKYEIYSYNGLYLDDEEFEKNNINKVDGKGLLELLNNNENVFSVKDTKLIKIDNDLLKSCALLKNVYYCMIRDRALVILPLNVGYTIKVNGEIVAIYDKEIIRDIKYNDVLAKSVDSIIGDIKNSEDAVKEINKQMCLKKIYNSLFYIGSKK